jgi:hypothetical protein
MALADLRALARTYAGGVARAGTPGTPGTRDFGNARVGGNPAAAPALPPPSPEQAADEAADHAAALAVASLPARPIPANGYARAALQRPPSWFAEAPQRPTAGAWCSCCRGQRWWSDDGRGWCCMTCHPPPPALPGQGARIMEVGT